MRFEEALKQTGQNSSKVIKRRLWGEKTPYKYLWVTGANTLVASVGNGNSCPPLMEVSNFLAEDWEVSPK